MNISIGSPAISFIGIADTGSVLAYGRNACFKQTDSLIPELPPSMQMQRVQTYIPPLVTLKTLATTPTGMEICPSPKGTFPLKLSPYLPQQEILIPYPSPRLFLAADTMTNLRNLYWDRIRNHWT